MKTKILVIILAVLASAGSAVAVDLTFTSSGQILPGEEWGNVQIYNDDTVVDMFGGDVDGIATYDASTINVTGGSVSTLEALEFSRANVSGGYVYTLWTWNSGTATLSGSASVFSVAARGDLSVVNMVGGLVDRMGVTGAGTLNLYGGSVLDHIGVSASGIANVYGYDLVKTASGGAYGDGQVYGFWSDGTGFTIDLSGPDTYDRINLIPEPSTLVLLALGMLVLRRRRI